MYFCGIQKDETEMDIASIIIAVVGFGGMSWIIVELLKLGKSVGRIEGIVDKLPCESHSDFIREIRSDLLEERTFLKTKFPTAKAVFSEKHSPSTLNENGLKLYSDVDGDAFLSDNGDYFLQKMESKKPKTALDVENLAAEVLVLSSNEDMFNRIKSFVYNYPALDIVDKSGDRIKYEVALGDVCFVLSLRLRDMYLQKHPELM